MAEFYLSSSSEILRNVNMDTGRRIALVGAPEDFKVWMEKLLPRDTCIVDEPVGLADCTFFDIITQKGDKLERQEIAAGRSGESFADKVIKQFGPGKRGILLLKPQVEKTAEKTEELLQETRPIEKQEKHIIYDIEDEEFTEYFDAIPYKGPGPEKATAEKVKDVFPKGVGEQEGA